jgi:hypothetical protein
MNLHRLTKNEQDVIDKLRSLRIDPNPPEERVSLSVEKEVLNSYGTKVQ